MTATTTPSSPLARYRTVGLAAVLLVLIAYFGGEGLIDRVIEGPLEAARSRRTQLQRDVEQREASLQRLREAGKLLVRWEDQSLPADTEAARSLYQAWLVELVDDVGLGSPSVTSSEPVARAGLYYTLSFSVRGRGTLEQLTKFLFAFYQADLLHQLRSLTITPLQRAEDLDLSFAVETLVLEPSGGAGAKKEAASTAENVYEQFRRRTWRVSDRLASDNLQAYDAIVRRNLFALGGGFDPTDHTYLTSITQVNGEPEVWFTNRATDEVVKLRADGRLELGPLTFRLAEILDTDVIIETEGERWLLSLGDRITDAYALPPGF
jgi:hypothetical protein